METIVIFGTGEYGNKAYEFLKNKNEYKIIGVCDSNVSKHGQMFGDHEIKSLFDSINVGYDVLLLCAAKWEELLTSAVNAGYDVAKMKIYANGIKEIKDSYVTRVHSQDGEEFYLKERIGGKKVGIYIDVGAFHPIRFSNTLWAYEKGWHGINIEPNPDAIELFRILRPKDINLNVGISNVDKTLKYYRYKDGALNTFSQSMKKHYEMQGYLVDNVLDVPVTKLQNILDKYAVNKIDFLDIDVEGSELDVLKGIDFNKTEIDIIMVEEATMSLYEIMQSETTELLKKYKYEPIQRFNRTVFYEKMI